MAPVIEDEKTADPEQNKMWRSGQSAFSAKPKNMWELGIHAGHAFVSGDVEAPFPAGYGFGLHVRKAINYTLSLRLDGRYQSSKGYDARNFNFLGVERTYLQNVDAEPILAGYTDLNTNDDNIHRNYKANIMAFTLDGILNIGNVLFHNPSNKWNAYIALGGGLYIPKISVDLLNGDQLYDFSGVTEGLDLTTKSGRNDARKNLKELLDGDFETDGGEEQDVIALGDHKTIIPHFNFGVGISRKLSDRINLSLEHSVLVSDNDLMDAFEDRSNFDETTSNDIAHYTSIRLGINLGSFDKRVEPLYWVNPLDGPLNDIAELKQRPKFDLTDSDGDGVIDMTDQEVNTPAGCPVDTRGVTLDSDGDSVADCKDQEPYSPPGYEVNSSGVAQVPDKYLTEDEVVNLITARGAGMGELNWFLPMIHFDLDKYYIKPEFYGSLHQVATVMNSHPDMKVVARGYTDNRSSDEYNNVLSYNRAKAAIDYLVSNYNLPRSRFLLAYGGEDSPIVKGLKDSHNISATEEYKQYINRRVEFFVAKATDTDMSRPAGPEAGENTPGSSRPGSKYSGNRNSGY
jgi:outer membrane protein OmpA-like peptidoglycan-associated protein